MWQSLGDPIRLLGQAERTKKDLARRLFMRANRLVGAPEDRIRVGAVGDRVRETEEERAGRGRENNGEISQQCLIYSNRKRA